MAIRTNSGRKFGPGPGCQQAKSHILLQAKDCARDDGSTRDHGVRTIFLSLKAWDGSGRNVIGENEGVPPPGVE